MKHDPTRLFVTGPAFDLAVRAVGNRMEAEIARRAYGDQKNEGTARARVKRLRSTPVSPLGTRGISPEDEARRLTEALGVPLEDLQTIQPSDPRALTLTITTTNKAHRIPLTEITSIRVEEPKP